MFPQARFLLFLKLIQLDEEKNTTSEKLGRLLGEVCSLFALYLEVIFWVKM